jgi:hypothetical protein
VRVVSRVALASAGLISVVLTFALASYVLPFPTPCLSITCGKRFDSGGVNVFGRDIFTLPQTAVMIVGILAAAILVGRAIFPTLPRASLAAGIAVLAVIVAVTLPSRVIGEPPTVPCSTSGPNGSEFGACVSGPTPTDPRGLERLGLVSLGGIAIALAVLRDLRSRVVPAPSNDATVPPAT